METNLDSVLARCLNEGRRRIIIPGFGALIRRPDGEVVFVDILNTNDGILVDEVERATGLSVDAALKTVDDYSYRLREELLHRREVRIAGVGIIRQTTDGNVELVPEGSESGLISKNYGIEPVPAEDNRVLSNEQEYIDSEYIEPEYAVPQTEVEITIEETEVAMPEVAVSEIEPQVLLPETDITHTPNSLMETHVPEIEQSPVGSIRDRKPVMSPLGQGPALSDSWQKPAASEPEAGAVSQPDEYSEVRSKSGREALKRLFYGEEVVSYARSEEPAAVQKNHYRTQERPAPPEEQHRPQELYATQEEPHPAQNRTAHEEQHRIQNRHVEQEGPHRAYSQPSAHDMEHRPQVERAEDEQPYRLQAQRPADEKQYQPQIQLRRPRKKRTDWVIIVALIIIAATAFIIIYGQIVEKNAALY